MIYHNSIYNNFNINIIMIMIIIKDFPKKFVFKVFYITFNHRN